MNAEGHIILTDGKKSITIFPLYVLFPNGQSGIRLDYVGNDLPFSEDFGTIYYNKKNRRWRIVNW
jgi:hypothetical protein